MKNPVSRFVGQMFWIGLVAIGMVGQATADNERVQLKWESPLAQDHPLVGRVYNSDGSIKLDALGGLVANSKYVLIGEKHDNSDHHQLELYLLELMLDQGTDDDSKPSMAVVLEMLDSKQQPLVNSVTETLAASDSIMLEPDQLKVSLDWPEHGWVWSDYAAIIGWTLNSRLPLVAGNISRKTISTIYQNGIDDRFATGRSLKGPLNGPLLDQVFSGHCELMPRSSLGSMVDIQLAKDSSMANALIASTTKQSVLIAGTGHIRKDTAVPRHLELSSNESVLTLALVEVDSAKQAVSDYEGVFDQFDIVIFTPVANERDYCAEFEKSMRKE